MNQTMPSSAVTSYCLTHGNPLPCPSCTSSATIPVVTPAAQDVAEWNRALDLLMRRFPGSDYHRAIAAARAEITRLSSALAQAKRERELLRQLIETAMAIPNMTDEQLAQLLANCRAAITAGAK